MTTLSPAPTQGSPRALAWGVLAAGLVLALAFAAQASRHGWAAAPATGPTPPFPPATSTSSKPAPPLVPDSAAPAAGTTGTMALPALPAAALAAPLPADLGVVAAAPFRFGRVGVQDRSRALQCLTAAVYYEAASEPDAGQQAVAQVVLNRVRHPAFPASVCDVVYQGSEHAGCQFSFACDGSIVGHVPTATGWARAARVAAAALAGRVYAPVGLATHYHTVAVTPAWNRALVMTDAVGAHLFHRWKGWWGTPAAFRRIYAGGEPLPGPHLSAATPTPVPILAAAAVPPTPATPTAAIQPAWRTNGTARTAPPPTDTLPAAPSILPRWAESGRALR